MRFGANKVYIGNSSKFCGGELYEYISHSLDNEIDKLKTNIVIPGELRGRKQVFGYAMSKNKLRNK